jgi:hypothetical protein
MTEESEVMLEYQHKLEDRINHLLSRVKELRDYNLQLLNENCDLENKLEKLMRKS